MTQQSGQEITELAPVSITDATGLDIISGQISSCERETKQFKETLENTQKEKASYVEQADIAREVRKLQADNFEKVPAHIQWKWETLPRFWELQKTILQFKHREEEAMDVGKLKYYDDTIAKLTEGIKRNEDKLVALKKQIADVKAE
jgi:hypothetical protein